MASHTPANTVHIRPGEIQSQIEACTDHRLLYADPEFQSRFVEHIASIVERDCIEMLSFDIFDTALLRSQVSELGRFNTVSAGVAREIGRGSDDLLVARLMAARACYGHAPAAADGTREGRLDDIAQVTCDLVGAPDCAKNYVAVEMACEAASLTPNPLLLRLVADLGLPFMFISDMYLSAPQIVGLLGTRFGASPRLYSSSSGAGSKRCGGLFDAVAADVGVDSARILHFGDSLASDYQQAKRHGWSSFYMPLPISEVRARRACFDRLQADLLARGHDVRDRVNFTM